MALSQQLEQRLANARIHIATPCYGGLLTANYALSLMQSLHVLREYGTAIVVNFIRNEALITRARNTLAGKLLADPKATHLVFIDADINWSPEALVRLICHDLPVSGGACPMKGINWDAIASAAARGKKDLNSFAAKYAINFTKPDADLSEGDDLVEVQDLGTGFMMIKRHVLEGMRERYPDLKYRNQPFLQQGEGLPEFSYGFFDTMYDPDTGYYLSEDYAFCRRWQAMGGKVMIDRKLALNHIGTYEFKGDVSAIWSFHDDGAGAG